MDVNRMKWKDEMEKMLSAIDRQTTHSLCVIKSIFKQSGQSFPPDFKQHFLHASSNRIKLTYEQFEINSSFDESPDVNLNSTAHVEKVTGGSSEKRNRERCGLKYKAKNGRNPSLSIDGSDNEAFMMETLDRQPIGGTITSFASSNEIEMDTFVTRNTSDTYTSNGPVIIDDSHETDESIPDRFNSIESRTIGPEVGSHSNFVLELDDSNDSIEMVENQNDSTDADDNELNSVHDVLDHLNEMTSSELAKGNIKAKGVYRKNVNLKRFAKLKEMNPDRDSWTIEDESSQRNQLASRNQRRRTVCGHVYSTSYFSKHMRTHSGDKLYGCDQCGQRFARRETLMKHIATHIAEFPFHCSACFNVFSSKTEAVEHEKLCRKCHYVCYLCKKLVTFDKAELIIHMRKHTGNKPFRCGICMKHFGRKDNLKRHVNTIHSRNGL